MNDNFNGCRILTNDRCLTEEYRNKYGTIISLWDDKGLYQIKLDNYEYVLLDRFKFNIIGNNVLNINTNGSYKYE